MKIKNILFMNLLMVTFLIVSCRPVYAESTDYRWSILLGKMHERNPILTVVRKGDMRLFMAATALCSYSALTNTFSTALAGPKEPYVGVVGFSLATAVALALPPICLAAHLDTRPIMLKSSREVREDLLRISARKAARGRQMTKVDLDKYYAVVAGEFGSRFCARRTPPAVYENSVVGRKYESVIAVPEQVAIDSPRHVSQLHGEMGLGNATSLRNAASALYDDMLPIDPHLRDLFAQKYDVYPNYILTQVTCKPGVVDSRFADPDIEAPAAPAAAPFAPSQFMPPAPVRMDVRVPMPPPIAEALTGGSAPVVPAELQHHSPPVYLGEGVYNFTNPVWVAQVGGDNRYQLLQAGPAMFHAPVWLINP